MFLYFMQGIEKTSCIFQTYVLKWDKDSEPNPVENIFHKNKEVLSWHTLLQMNV